MSKIVGTALEYVIGVDLGGTNIKASTVDANGAVIADASVETPVKQGRKGILAAVKRVVGELLHQTGPVAAIGVGSAGRIDSLSGTVRYATDNLPGWTGTRISEELAASYSRPVFVENDVNAAAIGEGWKGAAADHSTIAFIALGTGVGGALVWNGRVIPGLRGSAGEIGHLIVQPGGRPCNCGQRGCLEQYASGTALNFMARTDVPDWDSRKLLEAFKQGDSRADTIMNEFVRYLAVGLINVQNLFDPEAILIGGGLGSSYPLWEEKLCRELAEISPVRVVLKQAALGNKAGIIGAAKMAWDGYHAGSAD